MWSDRLVEVCVVASNTCLDPAGINTAVHLLTNLINISLVKFKHLEKIIFLKQLQMLRLNAHDCLWIMLNDVSRQNTATAQNLGLKMVRWCLAGVSWDII